MLPNNMHFPLSFQSCTIPKWCKQETSFCLHLCPHSSGQILLSTDACAGRTNPSGSCVPGHLRYPGGVLHPARLPGAVIPCKP